MQQSDRNAETTACKFLSESTPETNRAWVVFCVQDESDGKFFLEVRKLGSNANMNSVPEILSGGKTGTSPSLFLVRVGPKDSLHPNLTDTLFLGVCWTHLSVQGERPRSEFVCFGS